jgi:hypothetical protein
MNFADINYLAVIVAAIAAYAIGAAWYSFLFSKAWQVAIEVPADRMKARASPMPFIVVGVAYLIMAFVLSGVANPQSIVGGVFAGIILWLGFVVTSTAANYAFATRKMELTLIDSGHWLAALVVIGGIIGAFG